MWHDIYLHDTFQISNLFTSKKYYTNFTFRTHAFVTLHLSLSVIFNIIPRRDIILITIFYYFSLAYIHSLRVTLITTAQSLTILSILLNFKTSRDIKMRFCHTLHNKAFTERNPGMPYVPKCFQVNYGEKRASQYPKTIEMDWSHLCELKGVRARSFGPISHSIIDHRRWQKWRDIIAFRNFKLASRTPNNSSPDAPWDVQLSTRIKRVSGSAWGSALSTPRRLFERKLHFASSTWSVVDYQYRGERERARK